MPTKKSETPNWFETRLAELRLDGLDADEVSREAFSDMEDRFDVLSRALSAAATEAPANLTKVFRDLAIFAQSGDIHAICHARAITKTWTREFTPNEDEHAAAVLSVVFRLYPELEDAIHRSHPPIPVTAVETVIFATQARSFLESRHWRGLPLWMLAVLGSADMRDASILSLPFKPEGQLDGHRWIGRGVAKRWLARRGVPGFGKAKKPFKLEVVK